MNQSTANAINDCPIPQASLRQEKKKGCKQSKCSKWKGGKCKCGRE